MIARYSLSHFDQTVQRNTSALFFWNYSRASRATVERDSVSSAQFWPVLSHRVRRTARVVVYSYLCFATHPYVMLSHRLVLVINWALLDYWESIFPLSFAQSVVYLKAITVSLCFSSTLRYRSTYNFLFVIAHHSWCFPCSHRPTRRMFWWYKWLFANMSWWQCHQLPSHTRANVLYTLHCTSDALHPRTHEPLRVSYGVVVFRPIFVVSIGLDIHSKDVTSQFRRKNFLVSTSPASIPMPVLEFPWSMSFAILHVYHKTSAFLNFLIYYWCSQCHYISSTVMSYIILNGRIV